VIGPSQRPLPDNTQKSQETDSHAPAGFDLAIPASERPQTHVLHRAAAVHLRFIPSRCLSRTELWCTAL